PGPHSAPWSNHSTGRKGGFRHGFEARLASRPAFGSPGAASSVVGPCVRPDDRALLGCRAGLDRRPCDHLGVVARLVIISPRFSVLLASESIIGFQQETSHAIWKKARCLLPFEFGLCSRGA